MDLSEDQADELFGDERERDLDDVVLTEWLTIEQTATGYVIETDDERWRLTNSEMDEMQAELDWDSPWRAISERLTCIRYLREHNDQ